jgi:hypothetical protein
VICRKEAVVESWGQIIGWLRIYGGAGQVVWAIYLCKQLSKCGLRGSGGVIFGGMTGHIWERMRL